MLKNYIENHPERIIPTPGGTLCEVTGAKDNAPLSIALVTMDQNSKGIKHYHDNLTEIYVFCKGKGKIIINEHEHIINDGDCYIIPKNNVHYIEAIEKMAFCCICTPPWTPEHEFEVNEYCPKEDISLTNSEVLADDVVSINKLHISNSMEICKQTIYVINGEGFIDDVPLKPNDCFELNDKHMIISNNLDLILITQNPKNI